MAIKKRNRKNVSDTIINGTAVMFKDGDLEFGKNTKSKDHAIRLGFVIDSNKKGHVALAKRQHSNDPIQIGNIFLNPHFKIRDKNGNLLSIDNVILTRAAKHRDISPYEANEIKRQGLKDKPKNTRKPNRKRLKELKGRK